MSKGAKVRGDVLGTSENLFAGALNSKFANRILLYFYVFVKLKLGFVYKKFNLYKLLTASNECLYF